MGSRACILPESTVETGHVRGTQIRPRDDTDYKVWAQLGVTHVCVDPPGNPHHWSLDDLRRHRETSTFALSLDMVHLPMSSRPIEEQESPNILWGRNRSGSARSTGSAT